VDPDHGARGQAPEEVRTPSIAQGKRSRWGCPTVLSGFSSARILVVFHVAVNVLGGTPSNSGESGRPTSVALGLGSQPPCSCWRCLLALDARQMPRKWAMRDMPRSGALRSCRPAPRRTSPVSPTVARSAADQSSTVAVRGPSTNVRAGPGIRPTTAPSPNPAPSAA